MRWHRWEVRAQLEDGMTEGRVDGSSLQLVTVCLSDDDAGEISDAQGRPVAPASSVVSYLRPREVRAQLEDGMTEGRVDGSSLQLVTVCLSDDDAGEISDAQGRPVAPASSVVSYLRPSEARALAFELLELAELADRTSEEPQ